MFNSRPMFLLFIDFRDFESCAILGYYEASIVNFLPTFWGQPMCPILRVQESKRIFWIPFYFGSSNHEDGTDGLY